jgi:hypothetical protein
MGVAIAATWTLDLVRGRADLSAGPFRAREEGGGSLLWPRLAEYGTAVALAVGGAGLLASAACGSPGHHEATRVITRLQRLVTAPSAW